MAGEGIKKRRIVLAHVYRCGQGGLGCRVCGLSVLSRAGCQSHTQAGNNQSCHHSTPHRGSVTCRMPINHKYLYPLTLFASLEGRNFNVCFKKSAPTFQEGGRLMGGSSIVPVRTTSTVDAPDADKQRGKVNAFERGGHETALKGMGSLCPRSHMSTCHFAQTTCQFAHISHYSERIVPHTLDPDMARLVGRNHHPPCKKHHPHEKRNSCP